MSDPAASVPSVVIDTNWVLDLWVFDDPRAQALRHALEQAQVRWLASPAMRDEFARVLDYPNVRKRLLAQQRAPDRVLALFDRHAHTVDTPPPCSVRCADPDDQVFIDLAAQHRAHLLSKDLLVLRLKRALQTHGVNVQREWPSV